jgi:prepilin signal peptidase PulO-like enzyme (type II secretory pathway)
VFKSWATFLVTFGLLLVALVAGTLLAALMDFQSGWIVVAFIPLAIVVVGWSSAIISFPRRTQLYAWYRPGTEVKIFVADGAFVVSANSRDVRMGLDDVKRMHRFGALAAIQFRDLQYVVIPAKLVPHWPDAAKPLNLNKRWKKPR